jgi:antitoxin component YwqK of YwqJK toxin-antitoxin module
MAELKKEYYETGELKSECFEINGKKHGENKIFNKNGQLLNSCSYVDGKKHGEERDYYENGSLRFTCTYVDDKIHGLEKWYSSKTGKLCYLRIFENGELDAEVKHSDQLDMLVEKDLI